MAHHCAAAVSLLVLALLASQAAAGAAKGSPLLVEKLTPSSHTAAKLASGYYETSTAQLCSSVVKNCAFFGCWSDSDGDSCDASDSSFETDFSCCGHHKGYDGGYSDDGFSSFNVGGVTANVGSCVWTRNFYTTTPPLLSSSPAVARLGDVKAVCTLNHEAENCGVPGCEKMVLTLQGHIYGSAVYSKTAIPKYTIDTTEDTDFEDDALCCYVFDEPVSSNIANTQACGISRRRTTADNSTAANGSAGRKSHSWSLKQKAGAKKNNNKQAAELQYDHHHDRDEGYYYNDRSTGYYGEAEIFSGTSYITRVHPSGSEKIEETGLFEFAFASDLDPIDSSTTAPYKTYHEITPQALKLVFTKEDSKEYYSGSKANRR